MKMSSLKKCYDINMSSHKGHGDYFVQQAPQNSFYLRVEYEIRHAISSTQKCVCGMEINMEIDVQRLTPAGQGNYQKMMAGIPIVEELEK